MPLDPPHASPNRSPSRPLPAARASWLAALLLGSAAAGLTWIGWPEDSAERRAGSGDEAEAAFDVGMLGRKGPADDLRSGQRSTSSPRGVQAHDAPPAGAASGRSQVDRAFPPVRAASGAATSHEATGGVADRPLGDSLVTWLPPAVLEQARRQIWDEQATESLERLMLLAFDANGDFTLDDFERISAVQAMRDAMWPTADSRALPAAGGDADAARRGASADETLRPEDLRLHHDVDESRRLDHAAEREEGGDGRGRPGAADPGLRASITQDFQLVDDGRLTAVEFARFLRRYRAGAAQADLNLDGHVDEADLRLFLDVARPIQDE